MKPSILCVDDEVDNLDALERLLRKNYHVLKASSGDQGLAILKQHPHLAVIVSDQRMPQMTGVEFLERSQITHPETLRILLTGYTDVQSVIAAVNEGRIYRYVTKPWDPVDFVNTVDKAVERFEIGQHLREKNIALEKALHELRSLDDAKNHFMVLINHELKTPLTSLLSYLELLSETSLTTEQKKFTIRIDQAAKRLQQLIEDSLQLISAETGVLKFNRKMIHVRKALDGVALEFAASVKGKKIKVDLYWSDSTVFADATILRSVIGRLLENAIKFSPKGATVTIASQDSDEGVLFSVQNPGPAISAKTIEKIAKPFSIDEDIMHHSQGSGLGLSLCQALLKTHGSALEFEYRNGENTVAFALTTSVPSTDDPSV